VRSEAGDELNSEFGIRAEGVGTAIYLESRSGALRSPGRRNPDYNTALLYILSRLCAEGFDLVDATVESSETQTLDPEVKRLSIGIAYPVDLARQDPSELRLRITRAQRVIGRPPDAGPGGNNTKRIRLLVRSHGGPDPDAVGQLLMTGMTGAVDEAAQAIGVAAGRSRGPGYATDSTVRKAVEERAMKAAQEALEADGWIVDDVSRHESYDFQCRRNDEELRVEVKGARGEPSVILVTANEVRHARERGDVALAVVSGVELERSPEGIPKASGGAVQWIQPWSISDRDLEPLAFSWRIEARNGRDLTS
jgi:hypothetical protein